MTDIEALAAVDGLFAFIGVVVVIALVISVFIISNRLKHILHNTKAMVNHLEKINEKKDGYLTT